MIILIRNHTGPVCVIWAKKWSLHKIETKIAYLAKLISDILWAIDRGHDPSNGMWKDPICLVISSACGNIYLKIKNAQTEALISASLCERNTVSCLPSHVYSDAEYGTGFVLQCND